MDLLTDKALEKEIDEIVYDFENGFNTNSSPARVKNLVKFALLKMYDSCQISCSFLFQRYTENIEKELRGEIIKKILTNSNNHPIN